MPTKTWINLVHQYVDTIGMDLSVVEEIARRAESGSGVWHAAHEVLRRSGPCPCTPCVRARATP